MKVLPVHRQLGWELHGGICPCRLSCKLFFYIKASKYPAAARGGSGSFEGTEQQCFQEPLVSSPGTQPWSRHAAQHPCGAELAVPVVPGWHCCPPWCGCTCAWCFPVVDQRGLLQAGSACTCILPAHGGGEGRFVSCPACACVLLSVRHTHTPPCQADLGVACVGPLAR